MLPLSVPPPAFLLDPPAGPPALEKPVKVQVGILHFNDGAAVMVEHARMVGLFVYRTLSGGEDIWDEGTQTWTSPPATLDALATLKPMGLAPSPPPPPPPQAPIWNGMVVAAGQKDAGGGDRFTKASGGAPAYRVRAFGSAERNGQAYAGLSDPSPDLLFVSAADSQRFAVALDPSPKEPTSARMILKNSALVQTGYLEIRAASPGPQIEIANCDASGNAFARIVLAADGSIHLTPGGSGQIVLHGTLHAEIINYQPNGGGGRVTL